jgi:hypothetical protein
MTSLLTHCWIQSRSIWSWNRWTCPLVTTFLLDYNTLLYCYDSLNVHDSGWFITVILYWTLFTVIGMSLYTQHYESWLHSHLIILIGSHHPHNFFLNQLVATSGMKARESNGFCSSPTFKRSHTETITQLILKNIRTICQYDNLSPEEISQSMLYKGPTRCNFGSMFVSHCKITLHVLDTTAHSAEATDLGHPHRIYTIPTHDMHQWLLIQFLVLLMMDAESIRNM